MINCKFIGALITCIFVNTTQAPAQQKVDQDRRIYQEAVANPNDRAKIDQFIATLIEVPAGSGRFLVEGDILLSQDELESYLSRLRSPSVSSSRSEELIVNVVGGKLDFISDPSKRKMRYLIAAASFPNQAAAAAVQTNFRTAARDWENSCPDCKIEFKEVTQSEANDTPPTFIVTYENVAGGPIASAFFPSTTSEDRVVRIYPGYFHANMGFDPVGVLRHEIGHILGYRHEHIVNIPGCSREGGNYLPITPYTPKSLMHYFCGVGGSFDLSIRPEDAKGHRCLYLTGAACPPASTRAK